MDNLEIAYNAEKSWPTAFVTSSECYGGCGSANFLYVALEHLKRLEGEVLNSIRDLSGGQASLEAEGFSVDPHQFLGIEINPRAAAIAEIVLWIGYLQWHYRIHGKLDLPEPILRDFKNIENRDALIDYDSKQELLDENGKVVTIWDGISFKTSAATGKLIPDDSLRTAVYSYTNPRKAEWPEADYIVGNPPFIGASTMRRALGDGYVDAVRKTFKGVVPESADFVMYWWHIAAELVRNPNHPAQQFGFITTNSLKQTFNRRVLEPHLNDVKNPLSLIFAVPDHPWVDSNDGAAVRISMTATTAGDKEGSLFQAVNETTTDSDAIIINFKHLKGKIFSDLNIGANLNSALTLQGNSEISQRGFELGNAGFILNQENARALETTEGQPVIFDYMNGRDLLQTSRNVKAINLIGYDEIDVINKYPQIYQWLLERVKPERESNRDSRLRKYWWLHRRSRADLKAALADINRFIATVETAKHRLFTFLDADILPDNKLINIAVAEPELYGLLSSRLHILWSLRAGSRLGVGNDPVYVKSTCFEKFPFPDLAAQQKTTISDLAEKIDLHRKQQQALHPKLSLTNIYNVLEKLRKEEVLDPKEQLINQQGLVSILRELHDELDRQVFAAYGWQDLAEVLVGKPGATTPLPDKSDEQAQAEEELLSRLVALNHQRAAEEKAGNIRWLRPDYQNPDAKANQQQKQTNMALAETKEKAATSKTLTKATWPKVLSEQIAAVIELLATPATCEEIADNFKRKPIKQVQPVLEALEALGRAQLSGDNWELGIGLI